LLLGASSVVQADNFTTLFALDCNHGLHLFPTHGLVHFGVDTTLLWKAFEFVQRLVANRAQCHCPSISTTDLGVGFNASFASILRILENQTPLSLSECTGSSAFTHDFSNSGANIEFASFPSSCSYASWMAGDPCFISFQLVNIGDFSLQLAVDHCTASDLPFISLSCSGVHCMDLMRPCSTDSDCAGGVCRTLVSNNDNANAQSSLNSALDALNIFNTVDSCSSIPSMGSYVLNQLMNFVASFYTGNSQNNVNGVQFCGVNEIINAAPYPNAITSPCSTSTGTNNLGILTCSNINSWNGILPDGVTNSVDPNRKNGNDFPQFPIDYSVSGVFPLLHIDCLSRVNLFAKSNFAVRFYLPAIHKILEQIGLTADNIENCRSYNGAGGGISHDQFEMRFLPWQPALWLYMGSVIGSSITPVPSFSDLYSLILQGISGTSTPSSTYNRLVTPTGCKYTDWLSGGSQSCTFEYTGLQSLLNKDVSIRGSAVQCSSNSAPDIRFDCVGADCATVFQPFSLQFCQQDSDCGTGKTCNSLPTIPHFFAGVFWDSATPDTDSCDSESQAQLNVANLINALAGNAPTLGPISGYCTFDLQVLINNADNRFTTWQTTATSKSNNQITVNGLEAYQSQSGEPSIPSTSTTGSGPSSGAFRVQAIAWPLVAAFALLFTFFNAN